MPACPTAFVERARDTLSTTRLDVTPGGLSMAMTPCISLTHYFVGTSFIWKLYRLQRDRPAYHKAEDLLLVSLAFYASPTSRSNFSFTTKAVSIGSDCECPSGKIQSSPSSLPNCL